MTLLDSGGDFYHLFLYHGMCNGGPMDFKIPK